MATAGSLLRRVIKLSDMKRLDDWLISASFVVGIIVLLMCVFVISPASAPFCGVLLICSATMATAIRARG